MEKPTKRAPVVTKTAPHQAPGEPLNAVLLDAQLIEDHQLLEGLQRIERLEAALFPGRLRKP
jgi:hypothetical protein